MDKEEYHQKLDQLTAMVRKKDYKNALALVEEIDWRRVKSINTLNMVADVYEVNREYAKAKNILKLAHDRAPIGRNILYRLVEVCIKLGELDEAEKYFKEFSKTAKNDNSRCILQYKLYKAKNAPIEAQIDVLEEYRDREYTERWAYELALLYSKAGDRRKCIDTCDDLILWFSEGKFVYKALDLKQRYEALTPSQALSYEKMKALYQKSGRKNAAQELSEEDAQMQNDAASRAETFRKAGEKAKAKAAGEVSEARTEAALADQADAYEDRGSSVSRFTTTEEFKNKIAKSFKSVFLGEDDEADMAEAEAAEAAADKAELQNSIDAEKEYIQENGMKIRNLEDVDLSETAIPADGGENTASDEKAVRNDTFDLEAFLAETAGSFSTEIADKQFDTGKIDIGGTRQNSLEEDAVEASVNAEMAASDVRTAEAAAAAVSEQIPEADAEEAASEFDLENNAGTEAAETHEREVLAETKYETETAVIMEATAETAGSSEEDAGVKIAEADTATASEEETAAEADTTTESEEETAAEADTATASEEETAPEADIATGSVEEITGEVPVEENEISEQVPAAVEPAEMQEQAVNSNEDVEAKADTEMANLDTEIKRTPHYNEELEIPDPEPTAEERRTRTIPLGTIGQNTVPISIDKILSEETPEERRIRILNKAKPTRMSEDQRNIFTYFARIPGMDAQILEAINNVYEHAGERTSLHGNIAIMGARGTGKSRLAHGLIVAMCKDLGMDAAKVARITGQELNKKDPAKVVSMMAGGFLVLEDVSEVNAETLDKLNQAMEFRTDCMILIIEDEKTAMRAFLKQNPAFAGKFEKVISIPVFTNDELVTFARTYATENGCKIDDMAVLALYTLIGNSQSEEEPTTISKVKEMLDGAISRATKGKRRRGGADAAKTGKWVIIHEKDFALN